MFNCGFQYGTSICIYWLESLEYKRMKSEVFCGNFGLEVIKYWTEGCFSLLALDAFTLWWCTCMTTFHFWLLMIKYSLVFYWWKIFFDIGQWIWRISFKIKKFNLKKRNKEGAYSNAFLKLDLKANNWWRKKDTILLSLILMIEGLFFLFSLSHTLGAWCIV